MLKYYFVYPDTYQVPCKAGEVRLVNGYHEREGSVEFCLDGAWSTVCGKNWDLRATQTVCEQLRFPRHGEQYMINM